MVRRDFTSSDDLKKFLILIAENSFNIISCGCHALGLKEVAHF